MLGVLRLDFRRRLNGNAEEHGGGIHRVPRKQPGGALAQVPATRVSRIHRVGYRLRRLLGNLRCTGHTGIGHGGVKYWQRSRTCYTDEAAIPV